MLGTDPSADPKRTTPAIGDERLLDTLVANKPTAMLYRQVIAGGSKDPVEFSSPLRTVRFDSVQNISDRVELASTLQRNAKNVVTEAYYEMSVPLDALGLSVKPGMSIKGDVGVLRGNGFETMQRAYWSNKAAGIVSDIPSEAELTPGLWGTFVFQAE
jgi:hypothetical protein